MGEQKARKKILTTIQLLSIVFFVMFALIFAWVCYMITDVKKANYTLQNGEVRTAVIDGYATRGTHNDLYIPTYSYVDENGVEYSGMVDWGWENSEEEVSKHYGKKVEIIVDGQGYSIQATYVLGSFTGYIIALVIIGLVVVAMIILFSLETTKRVKKVRRYRDLFVKTKKS